MNRETWLTACAERICERILSLGYTLPPYRVAIAFTSKGAAGKTIGQAWAPSASHDKHGEIFIRCDLSTELEIAATLAHELAHLAVGVHHGHKRPFGKLARLLGLDGKLTATGPGPDFISWWVAHATELGPIPHKPLNFHGERTGPKKQATNLLKHWCPGCGYTARVTAKWIEIARLVCPNPLCDDHDRPMLVGDEEREDDGENEAA